MIISHKYKFIFIKPTKVAGTSIEVALAKHCGNKDIVTPVTKYSPDSDSEKYSHPAKNYTGFYNHISPEEIKGKVGEEIYDNYFKFTIVRNPWDLAVSRYWWEEKKKKIKIRKRKKIKSYYQRLYKIFFNQLPTNARLKKHSPRNNPIHL